MNICVSILQPPATSMVMGLYSSPSPLWLWWYYYYCLVLVRASTASTASSNTSTSSTTGTTYTSITTTYYLIYYYLSPYHGPLGAVGTGALVPSCGLGMDWLLDKLLELKRRLSVFRCASAFEQWKYQQNICILKCKFKDTSSNLKYK